MAYRMTGSASVAVLALLLVAQNALAQNPTFSARTELVLVPAIVTDHNGKHVHGLTRDDFIVREDGIEQKIASFEEIVASESTVHKVSGTTEGVYSNLRLSDYAPRRINIVVLDLINTKWAEQIYARRAILGYLSKTLNTDQLTAFILLTRGGVNMVHDFTTDTRVLMAALQRLSGEIGPPLPAEQQQATDTEATQIKQLLDSANAQLRRPLPQDPVIATVIGLESIANAFRGVPGRKALLWVSSGFPFHSPRPDATDVHRKDDSWFLDRYVEFFRTLNAANIAIYPIDARGLVDTSVTPEDTARATASTANRPSTVLQAKEEEHTATIQTILAFATMTGGRPFYNTNDLAGAMAAASDDSSSYYVLGYYAKTTEQKERWRKLTVKLQRSGLDVRARSGYYASRQVTGDREELRKRDIAEALDTPFDFTGIPFSVRFLAPQPAEANRKNVTFEVLMQPNSLSVDEMDHNYVNFQLVAMARDGQSKDIGGIDRQFDAHLSPAAVELSRSKGLSQRDQLVLPPGEYTLKFVLRDNLSGRVGSVSAPVTVDATPAK